MKVLRIDNYSISTPIIDILNKLKSTFPSKKLKEIKVKEDEIVVTCPCDSHSNGQEDNPDHHINIDDTKDVPYGWTHCFACSHAGSFERFVAEYLSSSVDVAKRWLIDTFGELTSEAKILDDFIDINKHKKSKVLDESILENYQHWTPYLAKRKLDRYICEKFKIRYDDKYRQVIFPIYNIHGKLKMLAKRNIDTKFFHMDADQEKEVYGLNIIQKNNVKSCMIVEGPIDLLTCWSNGIPAIATLGAVSDYQIEQINKSCLIHLYLCFDNDSAGEKFTKFVESKLSNRILTTKIDLPQNIKDVNDLTKEEWQELIKKYFTVN